MKQQQGVLLKQNEDILKILGPISEFLAKSKEKENESINGTLYDGVDGFPIQTMKEFEKMETVEMGKTRMKFVSVYYSGFVYSNLPLFIKRQTKAPDFTHYRYYLDMNLSIWGGQSLITNNFPNSFILIAILTCKRVIVAEGDEGEPNVSWSSHRRR